MVTDLSFERDALGRWRCGFVSAGACTVEINREVGSPVVVYASIGGLAEVPMTPVMTYNSEENMIFTIDMPVGVDVVVESLTEVSAAKMLTED